MMHQPLGSEVARIRSASGRGRYRRRGLAPDPPTSPTARLFDVLVGFVGGRAVSELLGICEGHVSRLRNGQLRISQARLDAVAELARGALAPAREHIDEVDRAIEEVHLQRES